MYKVAAVKEIRFLVYVFVLAMAVFFRTPIAFGEEEVTADSPQANEAVMAEPQAAEKATLDGKTFVGEIGKEGQEKGDKDTFIFKDGKFRSTACDAYGFSEAEYAAITEADKVEFDSTTVSPTDGTMQWHGTVKGDKLEGTVAWSKEGQEPIRHWFKATVSQ